MKVQEDKILPVIRTNNVFLEEDVEKAIYNSVENRINTNSVATLCFLPILFNNKQLLKKSLCFAERCFKIVADSRDFLKLDFKYVIKILSSEELNIDSELEVISAADAWLSHNIAERSKYAKRLLSTTRLHLLSDHALRYVLKEPSTFSANKDCAGILKGVLEKKKEKVLDKINVTARYCKQDNFDLLFCGGYTIAKTTRYTISRKNIFENRKLAGDAYTIDARNCKSVKHLPSMKENEKSIRAVCIGDEVYAFTCHNVDPERAKCVERYSRVTNSWQVVAASHDDRQYFCACAFMNDVYVVGGELDDGTTNSCLRFNTKSLEWRGIAGMREERISASCAAFEGRVVVSGGRDRAGRQMREGALKSVEAYDHAADKWTRMPDMEISRFLHKSVAIKNKLFVVGGFIDPFEVYDSTCNKFTVVWTNYDYLNFYTELRWTLESPNNVFSIGSKLVMFNYYAEHAFYYDVDSEKWEEEECKIAGRHLFQQGVKIPHM